MKKILSLIFLSIFAACTLANAQDFTKPFTLSFQAYDGYDDVALSSLNKTILYNYILTPDSKKYLNFDEKFFGTSETGSTNIFYFPTESADGTPFGYFLINNPEKSNNFRNPTVLFTLDNFIKVSDIYLEVQILSIPETGSCNLYAGTSAAMINPSQGVRVQPTEGYTYVRIPFDYGTSSPYTTDCVYFKQDADLQYKLKSVTIVPEGTSFNPPTSEPELKEVELTHEAQEGDTYRIESQTVDKYRVTLPQPKDSDAVLSFEDFQLSVGSNNGLTVTAEADPSNFNAFILKSNRGYELEEGLYTVIASLKEESGYKGSYTFIIEVHPGVDGLLFNGETIKEGKIDIGEYMDHNIYNVVIEGIPNSTDLYWKIGIVEETENPRSLMPSKRGIVNEPDFNKYVEADGMDLSEGNVLYFYLEKNKATSDIQTVSYQNIPTTIISILSNSEEGEEEYYTLDGLKVKDIHQRPAGIYIKKTGKKAVLFVN